MLLSLMRKNAKSWLIKFLIAVIALVFIFYFGYSFRSKEGLEVAVVNGEKISGVEYQRAYRNLLTNLQREYKTVWNDNLIEVFDLKNRALEDLIDRKIMSQEARKIGLDITEEEIRNQILLYPAFQFRGRFDENRYQSVLANNRMKPEDFEEIIAQDLLQQKLNQFLTTFLLSSDQEIQDQYTYANQKVKLSFVRFSPDEFLKKVRVDPDSMKKYFEEHKEEYRVPDRIKIAYISISPDTFRDKVKVDDQEIIDFYEDNLEMFKVAKQVKASHILFKLDENAPAEVEKKVKDKAMAVLEEARSGRKFSELAKQYSEGPTRDKGGDLGYFSKGQMVKSFEDAAFRMKKGQISDLVRTPFGYHIIKVEDIREARTKDLKEVRDQISEILIRTKSMDLADEKALSLIDQMPYDVNLVQYANEHEVPVTTSGYFSQDEPLPVFKGDPKLIESIFSLPKNGVSDLLEHEDVFYIIQVIDKEPSYLPDIKEVSDQVHNDYTQYLAKIEAKSAAEDNLALLKGKSSQRQED